MKYFILLCGIFILLLGLKSCGLNAEGNEKELVRMKVNHFKQTAFGSAPQLVLLIQEDQEIGEVEWSYFYDQIEGFDYQSGYTYELLVVKEENQDPPVDGSSFHYTLERIISKMEAGPDEIFEIKLKWGGATFVNYSGGNYDLMDQYPINCQDLCEEMMLKLGSNEEVTAQFSHAPGTTLRLRSIL